MTLIARTFLICLSILVVNTTALSAPTKGLGRALSPENATAGTLLVQSGSTSQRRAVPLLNTDVSIGVTGMISRTTVVQHFINPSEQWLEGIYVFPLPTMAAVDTLRMKIGERTIVGQIEKRAEARRTYNKAKQSGRKATLLEQERPNIFTASVANIGPGEKIEILIEYQQELTYVDGVFSLRFPMVVGPRYIPGSQTVEGFSGSGWGKPTRPVADAARITPPVVRPESGPINPVRIRARIDAGFPSQIKSPSHQITIKGDPRVSQIELTNGVVPADQDFVLSWQPLLGKSPNAALFSDVFNDDTYALIMLMPPTSEIPPTEQLSREVIFVIDISGSMDGRSIVQAREALRMALERLSPTDSFNVIPFNSDVYSLFDSSQKATPENLEYATRHVSRLETNGGTEMMPALRLALGSNSANPNSVRQVFFITDGSVGNESALFSYIKKNIGRSRLFTVGIGSAPNSYFMRKAAEFGRGTFTYIGQTHEVKKKMTALFAKLESPIVTGIEFDWNGENVQHWPQQVPDLYLGEPIVIVAKLNHLSGRVQVHGQRGTTPWKLNFTLKGGRTESGIDRLFARRKIASLTASIAGGADARLVRTQIVELGLAHHLVTQHTSLVAVEQATSRPDGTPLNTSSLPTNLPKGWVYDSLFQQMNQPVIRDQDADGYYQMQSASKNSYSRSVANSTTIASLVNTKRYKEERRQIGIKNMNANSAITPLRKMEKAQITAKSKSSVNSSQISNGKRTTTKSSTAIAPSKTTVAISNQDTQRQLAPTQTQPSANTPRRYTTGQPTVLAKLQEIAGVLPKTATPAQLLFLVGLVLLLMAAWFRLRRTRI